MNFVIQLLRQCWFVWQKIGLNQRITIVLMLVAIFGAVAAIGFWAKQPEYVLLYSRLEGTDAAEIVAKLKERDILCQFDGSQSAVLVPRNDLSRARLALAGEGLPKGDSVGFEIFNQNPIGMTDFMQKVNYNRAVQGQLERNISSLEEVERARVMIAVPQEELFREDKKDAKASVTLKLRSGNTLSAAKVSAIKHLVAAAVPGLDAQNVTIIDTAGNLLSRSVGANSVVGMTDEQLALQAAKEKHLAGNVETMLETALGINKAIVRVSAELNFQRVERNEEKIDPESAVVVSENIETDESTESAGEGGAPPGVTANTGAPQTTQTQAAASPGKKSKQSVTNTYDFARESSRTVSEVGNVKRLSVAVFIAQKAEGTGDQRKYVARPAEEMKVIENIVKSAVGYTENESRQDQVTVAEIPFDTSGAEKSQKEMEDSERREMILTLTKVGATCGIILVMLLFFRSFLRKAPPEHFPLALPVLHQSSLPEARHGLLLEGRAAVSNAGTGMDDVKNEVGRLAQEKPEQVAQVLKGWIAQKPS